MYGWSNDLFFAPANPGITLYDQNKKPIEGDVSAQIKLWDNGTRVNQKPGIAVNHPGIAENSPVTEVNGLTQIAEAGNNAPLYTYIKSNTGIFTPLSPILVVVYNRIENPIYKLGEKDRNEGLKELAQQGNAALLAAALKGRTGVKNVYILPAPGSTVLLPVIGGQAGGNVTQELSVTKGDRIAIATMYGFSNDWFFASAENGVDATQTADISGSIKLFDNGTAIDQFPGAGNTQFNLGGTTASQRNVIAEVPNPNPFTTLPLINNIIKVKINVN